MTKTIRPRRRFHCAAQFGVIKPWMLVVLLLAFAPLLTLGFYEGRKAYWDAKVREMCEIDGGSVVFARTPISNSQFQNWGGIGSVLGIPNESEKRIDIPFFRRTKRQILHEKNPVVMRLETVFIRRVDGELLGQSVYYFRRGGDFPSWAHESSFGCVRPEPPIESQIFIIQESKK